MNIPLKCILYDEPAAIAEIQKVKEETAAYNRSIRPHNRMLKLFIVLFWTLCIIGFSLWFIVAHAPHMHWMLLLILFIGLPLVHKSGYETYWGYKYPGVCEEEERSANACYYLLLAEVNPAKVLAVELDGLHLCITYEDENNVVREKRDIWGIIRQECRTDITELSLNLPKSTLYVPYNAQ